VTQSVQREDPSVYLATPRALSTSCDISLSLKLLALTWLSQQLDDGHLRRYLGRSLVILLGDADNDASAPDLPRMDYAMAQGPHRLARGLWHFKHCMKLADSIGVHFGWRLEIAHGAGHVGQQIYDQGADILKG